jgi:hypothetical protein
MCQMCLEKKERKKKHVCGKSYCRSCDDHYDKHLPHHDCVIQPAKPLVHVDGFAVWDTETIFCNAEGRHRVNAVGLAYEDEKRGHFSEVYFYSDSMNHPQDSQVKKHTFIYNYCAEDQEPPLMPREGEEEEEEKEKEAHQKDKKFRKSKKKLSRKMKRAASCVSSYQKEEL